MGIPSGTARIEGVVAVIASDGRLLMIQRADGVPQGGAWCFPGGAIQSGEAPEAALIREIREELGLSIRPDKPVWSWTRDDDGLALTWWEATIVGGTLRCNPREVGEARWMTPSEIRGERDVLENNVAFLDIAEAAGLFDR